MNIFELKLKPECSPIIKIRDYPNAQDYVPINYPSISKGDLMHINETLDEEQENSIGYYLRTQVDRCY